MAVLSTTDRAVVSQGLQSDLSAAREALGAMTKADFQAAVDAADTWADSNASSFNLALPQPARSVLTAAQKSRLLEAVIRRRWIVGA